MASISRGDQKGIVMGERCWPVSLAALITFASPIFVSPILVSLTAPRAIPATVPVRYAEGLVHGFLVLRTLEGDTIADGDLSQVAQGDKVTSRVVFHFKDGSVQDEVTVFSQRRNFRLLNDHLVQKGPSFRHPLDVSIDGSTGQVAVRSTDDGTRDF